MHWHPFPLCANVSPGPATAKELHRSGRAKSHAFIIAPVTISRYLIFGVPPSSVAARQNHRLLPVSAGSWLTVGSTAAFPSIHNARRNVVTASRAKMHGNCTWLTYRRGMAPGRQVSSGCITDATSGRRHRQPTHGENHPPTIIPLCCCLPTNARDRVRSSSIVWLRETSDGTRGSGCA